MLWLSCLLGLLMSINIATANNDTSERVRAFKEGEKLEFRLHYGFINAGIATIEVRDYNIDMEERQALHVVGTGRSVGAFDWFFKVRDRYESYIDKESLSPLMFVRRVNEGGYIINQDYTFYPEKNQVYNGEGTFYDVPDNVQDMISAFYYARTLDMSNVQLNDTLSMNCFLDDEIWPLQIKYKGIENLETDLGTFECLTFVPIVQSGRVFNDEEDLKVWITNDQNRIPVMAAADILVGSVKMEITKFEGLAHPLAIVED